MNILKKRNKPANNLEDDENIATQMKPSQKRLSHHARKSIFIDLVDKSFPCQSDAVNIIDYCNNKIVIVIDSDDDDPDIRQKDSIGSSGQITLPVQFKTKMGVECLFRKRRSTLNPEHRLESPKKGFLFDWIDLRDDDDDEDEITDYMNWMYVYEFFNSPVKRMRQMKLHECKGYSKKQI